MTSQPTLRERVREFAKPYFYDFSGPDEEDILVSFIESELAASATKIREEIRTMEREGGELEPYLEVVKTKNMDKMFDYAYEKARRDILALLPSEGESKEK